MLEVPAGLLEPFGPDPDALLDESRRGIDDGMLREIAEADYGEDAEAHLKALREIRDHGRPPPMREWVPCEVLELIRWSEPDDPKWKPGSTGERGHRMRAFACAALLRGEAERPGDTDLNVSDTLAQLMGSVLALGPGMMGASGRFLSWRVSRLGAWEDRPLFAFALLVLSAELGFGEEAVGRLAEWVVAEEAAEREAQSPYPQGNAWLLGLSPFHLKPEVWHGLGERLREKAKGLRQGRSREWVELVSGAIRGA